MTSPACYSLAFRLVGNEHDAQRRAAGGLPTGVSVAAALPGRRRLLDLAASHHGQLRRRSARGAPQERSRRRSTTSGVDFDRRAAGRARSRGGRQRRRRQGASRRGARASFPMSCGSWSFCATSTTSRIERSQRSSGSARRAAKVRLHRARRRLRERLFPPRVAAASMPRAADERGMADRVATPCDEVGGETLAPGPCRASPASRQVPSCRSSSTAACRASRALVAHVESCLRCQAELARYRRLVRLLHQLQAHDIELPAGLLGDVLDRARAGRQPEGRAIAPHRSACGVRRSAGRSGGCHGRLVLLARSHARSGRLDAGRLGA